VKMWMKN